MTVTLPEWLVWLLLLTWCAERAMAARLAWWQYRLEMERRRTSEHARRLRERFMGVHR